MTSKQLICCHHPRSVSQSPTIPSLPNLLCFSYLNEPMSQIPEYSNCYTWNNNSNNNKRRRGNAASENRVYAYRGRSQLMKWNHIHRMFGCAKFKYLSFGFDVTTRFCLSNSLLILDIVLAVAVVMGDKTTSNVMSQCYTNGYGYCVCWTTCSYIIIRIPMRAFTIYNPGFYVYAGDKHEHSVIIMCRVAFVSSSSQSLNETIERFSP